jgi:hypothetical protein
MKPGVCSTPSSEGNSLEEGTTVLPTSLKALGSWSLPLGKSCKVFAWPVLSVERIEINTMKVHIRELKICTLPSYQWI